MSPGDVPLLLKSKAFQLYFPLFCSGFSSSSMWQYQQASNLCEAWWVCNFNDAASDDIFFQYCLKSCCAHVVLCWSCQISNMAGALSRWLPSALNRAVASSVLQAVHKIDNSPLLLFIKHTLLAVQNVTTHTRQIRNKVQIYLYGNLENAGPLDNCMGNHS